jgi:hypothetical protein
LKTPATKSKVGITNRRRRWERGTPYLTARRGRGCGCGEMEVAWSGDGGLAEARWRGGAGEACSLLLAEFIGRRALNRGGAGRRTGARGKGGTARFRFAHASFRLLFVGGLKPAPAVSEPRGWMATPPTWRRAGRGGTRAEWQWCWVELAHVDDDNDGNHPKSQGASEQGRRGGHGARAAALPLLLQQLQETSYLGLTS